MGPLIGLAEPLVLPSTAADPPATTVLVADDDPGLLGLLGGLLAEEGLTVETAGSGREVLARLRDWTPDVIFLDVEMPGETGLDVLTAIRQRDVDTAVIITTAYGSEDVVAEALRRGANDYLRKPFDRTDVQAVLDRTTVRLLLSRQNAVLRAKLLEHQRRLEDEVARAAATVAELMPPAEARVAGYEVSAACRPARDAGGDFYDWQVLPSGRLSIAVGDVMGKGLAAALLMATVRAVLRALVGQAPPQTVVRRAARALDRDLDRSGAFVTLFHAQVDPARHQLRYVDAGHGYVVLRRASGSVETLRRSGLPLGVDAGERYAEGSLTMRPGDTLIVYSDGLVEARPELFRTRKDAAAAVAGRAAGRDARTIVRDLLESSPDAGPLPDDLTVMVLRRLPGGA